MGTSMVRKKTPIPIWHCLRLGGDKSKWHFHWDWRLLFHRQASRDWGSHRSKQQMCPENGRRWGCWWEPDRVYGGSRNTNRTMPGIFENLLESWLIVSLRGTVEDPSQWQMTKVLTLSLGSSAKGLMNPAVRTSTPFSPTCSPWCLGLSLQSSKTEGWHLATSIFLLHPH